MAIRVSQSYCLLKHETSQRVCIFVDGHDEPYHEAADRFRWLHVIEMVKPVDPDNPQFDFYDIEYTQEMEEADKYQHISIDEDPADEDDYCPHCGGYLFGRDAESCNYCKPTKEV